MKKFFENKYIDHILKTVIALLLGIILYGQIDQWAFRTYIQPYQNEKFKNADAQLAERCSDIVDMMESKNSAVHKRVDAMDEDIREVKLGIIKMDEKLDILMVKVGLIPLDKLLTEK